MKYLLDTHVWIWWNARPEALSPRVRKLLAAPDAYDELLLAAQSIWEFARLLESGRLGLSISADEWLQTALDMPKLRVVPLTPQIGLQAARLPDYTLRDATDQILIATAREENATIITHDPRIASYRHVRTCR